ncbi:hypothetical protein MRX96_008001 [Rhipicephalus microplus]
MSIAMVSGPRASVNGPSSGFGDEASGRRVVGRQLRFEVSYFRTGLPRNRGRQRGACSRTEEPFNTIRGCSRHGHVSVPWDDSGNYCGVTGDIWSLNYAAQTPRQSSNAFVTEDAEEECFRALRGHFLRSFGTGRPFGRRFFSSDQARNQRKFSN